MLHCHFCHGALPVPHAHFVGPIILCEGCRDGLSPCPEAGCAGLLLAITAGPDVGGWECSECEGVFRPEAVPGGNVLQFPEPGGPAA